MTSSSSADATNWSLRVDAGVSRGVSSQSGRLDAPLVDDLQKCRRLVASMRGLVTASSVRQQVLDELVHAVELKCGKKALNVMAPSSPRARYLYDFQRQRIRIIQKLWKSRFRTQKLILAKLKMEQRWRENKGVKRFEASAVLVQRIFRGFYTRKQTSRQKRLSIAGAIVIKHKMSKLELLRTECAEYKKKLTDHEQQLRHHESDLETLCRDRAATEQKIAASKKGITYIDTKLLDGTAVRMEANQLLVHQTSEIERLQLSCKVEQAYLEKLRSFDLGANHAALIIQSSYRTFKYQLQHNAKLRRKRQAFMRLIISKEQCYQRMNENIRARQERMWSASSSSIASLYRITKAKQLLRHLQENHAARRIALQYRLMRVWTKAKARLSWLRTKRRAHAFRSRRVHEWLIKVWTAWNRCIASEKSRKALIEARVEQGLTKWLAEKANRLQRLCHIAIARREHVTKKLLPRLNPVLLHNIDMLFETMALRNATKRDLCFAYYQEVLQEVKTWREPPKHLYLLSQRYKLPLEALPVKKIRSWVKRRQPCPTAFHSGVFVDLHQPFPVRTLEFLAQLSDYYARYYRVTCQIKRVWIEYEAKMVVRGYLAMLYANNQVFFTPGTTSSDQLRQDAVKLLRSKDEDELVDREYVHSSEFIDKNRPPSRRRDPFTSFHCLWNDLCEKCLVIQSTMLTMTDVDDTVQRNQRDQQRVCSCCGHHRYERSTAANAGYAALPKILLRDPSGKGNTSPKSHKGARELFCEQEKFDFLVINAFFHALAPFEHENRDQFSPEVLWKQAMAHAYTPVMTIYERFQISSLNSLVLALTSNTSSTALLAWSTVLPPPVLDKLLKFAKLLYEELLAIEKQVRMTVSR